MHLMTAHCCWNAVGLSNAIFTEGHTQFSVAASLLYVARTDEHCEGCAVMEPFQRQPLMAWLCLFGFLFVFLSRNICMLSNMAFSPVLIFSP